MKKLLAMLLIVFGVLSFATDNNFFATDNNFKAKKNQVEYTHIRNATGILNYGGKRILIDPFFAPKGVYPGFDMTYSFKQTNPLIDLPMNTGEILKGIDAVLVTHTHLDHWDEYAQKAINKNILIFVQNESDKKLISSQGFKNIKIVGENTKFGNITMTKTKGQHGTDDMYKIPEIAKILGEAMGVVFRANGYETVYLVGDTIWRKDVEEVVNKYKPEIIIMNTGQAELAQESSFDEKAIIMGKLDLERMYYFSPSSKLVAVHMDTVNHGTLTRKELRAFLEVRNLDKNRVFVPNDGEKLEF